MKWRIPLAVLAMLAATNAHAYYFWTHYLTSSAPYTVAPEKYDLNALPNKTVTPEKPVPVPLTTAIHACTKLLDATLARQRATAQAGSHA